ncbi:MAG: glycosyltransferase 61 family protein [Burkholderiaceae bacterium]
MRIFSPVGQALVRRAGLSSSLADVCKRSFETSPSVTIERRKAICLEGESDRALGTAPNRSIELELLRLETGPYRVPASQTYELSDALFIDGNLHKGLAKHIISGETKTLLASVRETSPSGCIFANRQSHRYFGHWLFEELPAMRASSQRGPALEVYGKSAPGTHKVDYLRLYGIDDPTPIPSRCVIPHLTLITSSGFSLHHQQGLVELQDGLIKQGWARKNERIFVSRRGGAARDLGNEAQIIERLAAEGFSIIDPMSMSAEAVARACFDAKLIIGVEGSHLSHAFIQLRAGAGMVLIQPPTRFDNPFKDLCDIRGIDYGFVVADAQANGFVQPINRLLETIARMPV